MSDQNPLLRYFGSQEAVADFKRWQAQQAREQERQLRAQVHRDNEPELTHEFVRGLIYQLRTELQLFIRDEIRRVLADELPEAVRYLTKEEGQNGRSQPARR